MDWFNEIWNALVFHFTNFAPVWATPEDTAYLILIGLNIEICFMFAVAGIGFGKMLPPQTVKILGLSNRLFIAIVGSIVPVPAGWHTVDTGKETYILFSQTGNLESPDVRVRLSVNGYMDDFMTSADALAEFEKSLTTIPQVTILKQIVVDNDKSYIFLLMETETGQKRHLLQVFSRDRAHKWFYTFSVFTAQPDWESYYPLLRAMVERWANPANNPLGLTLPETLLD